MRGFGAFFWFFWSEDKLAADLLLGKLQNPEFFSMSGQTTPVNDSLISS